MLWQLNQLLMLMVCILIDGKEVLPQALQNEEVTKGVLRGCTHVEPWSVQTLNETTFLATYTSDILAGEIGAAVEKIENWLGKPVVITCDEITTKPTSSGGRTCAAYHRGGFSSV